MRPLHIIYDLGRGPITFDFANFLVLAELQRRLARLQSLSVTVAAGSRRVKTPRELFYSNDVFQWRVANLIQPLLSLLPSVSAYTVTSRPVDCIQLPSWPKGVVSVDGADISPPYSIGQVQELALQGHICRPFVAPNHAVSIVDKMFGDLSDCITITLRTSDFQPERNSSLKNWYLIYEQLLASGFRVIVIPDVEDLWGGKTSHQFKWPLAQELSFSFGLRLAVYERCHLNLCVNNGAAALLLYSSSRYLMCKMLVEGIQTTTEDYHRNVTKLEPGSNFAFAGAGQVVHWGDDDPDQLFERIKGDGLI